VEPRRRLLLISGSLRAGSTNSAALATVVAGVGEDVDAVVYGGMASLPHFNPDDDRDPLDPAVADLRHEIERADAVLFCTPEYAGALPGSFKNLLDWTVGGTEPTGTPAAWINVSAPGRGIAAHDSLRAVLTYTDFAIVDAACVQVPFTRSDVGVDGEIHDEQARAEIAEAVEVLLAAAPVSASPPAGAGSR
jgi:NAD(P)H-dependent FMN reductase